VIFFGVRYKAEAARHLSTIKVLLLLLLLLLLVHCSDLSPMSERQTCLICAAGASSGVAQCFCFDCS
jgi:hypothetical protein